MMYVKFPQSLRNFEDLLHERGIDICHEMVRIWWNRFGTMFARKIRNRRVHHHAYSNWRWHLDEVFGTINGETQYLWRAVDHEGAVQESFVAKRRDRRAALAFLKKAMNKYGLAKVIVKDRLKSYRSTMTVIGNQAAQEVGRWKNNRAEYSHLPFRRLNRAMSRFRLERSLQKFTSVHSSVCNHFNFQRHLISKDEFKFHRNAAFVGWHQLCAA